MEIPKEWMEKAIGTLAEAQAILGDVKEVAERFDKLDRDLMEAKKLIVKIKDRSKALMDKLPPWILELTRKGGEKSE